MKPIRPRRETPIRKMFKGRDRWWWEAALIEAGWPQPLAGLMAAYLTGEGPLPQWPTISGELTGGGGGAPGMKPTAAKGGPAPTEALDGLADEAERRCGEGTPGFDPFDYPPGDEGAQPRWPPQLLEGKP